MIILANSKFGAIFFVLEILLLCHLASSQWTKILKRSNLPEYKIKLKEPHLCDETVQQYSGYIDVKSTKHLFFWFFESRNKPQEDPIVLWLNGGPGQPSIRGLYFELGPCNVNPGGNDTTFNPYSWTSNSSIIFLDQPVNAGYSYGDNVSDTFTAAYDVYAFLQIFFQEFCQYANLDFHIAGESYAGHYIPTIASDINKYNNIDDGIENRININLKSILIGNGLFNALVEHEYLSKMACNSSYGPVLNNSACNQMRRDYIHCSELTEKCFDSKNVTNCVTAQNCFDGMFQLYKTSNRSVYDIRKHCDGDLCYPELQDIEKYCNREDVKTELGVNPSLVFHVRNANINRDFFNSGLDAWTKALKWSGTKGFNNAKVTRWITTMGTHSGDVRTFKGLTFLRIFESGHYVPHDQPIASLDFFIKWIFNKDL
ncbi:6145_t:CDS:2 [Cetraspora pellucida]|uniref:6145_t:CDS:1 n=1 Tax=Cetraspora pellucida TaxID=1433469 RepID=A0ACA9KAS7_9GLOM|nr:6145_t:CDS:2 [Cetraspora pellucida]